MKLARPLRAAILDWAGTTVDYGSRAPAKVFLEIFQRRGVEITVAEARGPMGRAKRDHILQVISLPRVAQAWQTVYGREPNEGDVDAMYEDFLPLQKSVLSAGSDVLPGIPQAIAELRARGFKIGSTTGYTRELMSVVAPIAADQGYSPDCLICSDDVPAGRPAPWMNFLAAQQIGVYPLSEIIICDDAPVGVEAAVNAGAIAVGVMQTGNALGLSEAEVAALPADELQQRLTKIEAEFRAAGAHYVIKSVAELPTLVAQITT